MVAGWSSIPWWSLGHTGGGVGLLLCAYPQQRHMEMIWLDIILLLREKGARSAASASTAVMCILSTCTPTIGIVIEHFNENTFNVYAFKSGS